MAGSSKPEFAPLLAPGRHLLSIPELRSLCVGRFTASTTRPALLIELERLVNTLDSLSIRCDIWVDGSFLTEKVDPGDIDLSIKIDEDVLLGLDANTFLLLEDIAEGRFSAKLDSYMVVSYPVGHPRRGTNLDTWPRWAQWWGLARGGWCKGVAVIRVGEGDVGLRLFS